MEGHNLQVAVRVRPEKENEQGQLMTLSVQRDIITIHDPSSSPTTPGTTVFGAASGSGNGSHVHSFSFDKVLWSASTQGQLTTGTLNSTGTNTSTVMKRHSQQDVFEHVGPRLVNNVMEGFNSCLFAYGQTGSGKTYSMIGDTDALQSSAGGDPQEDAERGVVPRLSSALFDFMEEKGQNRSYRLELSFVEIYCERVRDLLTRTHSTLRVRQSPSTGPYIEDLTTYCVKDAEGVMALIRQGMKERATAETKMNQRSSRSHAIVQLQVTAMWTEGDNASVTRQRSSKVNLVDLAGSERITQSGAVGERFEEARNINLSLTTLGRVIQCLVDIQQSTAAAAATRTHHCGGDSAPSTPTSPACAPVVPYRESQLTWLLSDSLGGNSKTMMLATVSPSPSCYQQSLNTLRFAGVAQKVVNVVRVNEEKDSLAQIAELRDQVERLTLQLGHSNQSGAMNHRVTSLTVELEKSQDQCRNLQGKLKTITATKEHEELAQQRKLQALVAQQAADLNTLKAQKTVEGHHWKSEVASKNAEIQELRECIRRKDVELNTALARAKGVRQHQQVPAPSTPVGVPGSAPSSRSSSVNSNPAVSAVPNIYAPNVASTSEDFAAQLKKLREQSDSRTAQLAQQLTDAKDELARLRVSLGREEDKRRKTEKTAKLAVEQQRSKVEELAMAKDSAESKWQEATNALATLQDQHLQLQVEHERTKSSHESTQVASTRAAEEERSTVQKEVSSLRDTVTALRKRNVELQTEARTARKAKEEALDEQADHFGEDIQELEVLLLEETESAERYYLAKQLSDQLRPALLSALQQALFIANEDSLELQDALAMTQLLNGESIQRQQIEADCQEESNSFLSALMYTVQLQTPLIVEQAKHECSATFREGNRRTLEQMSVLEQDTAARKAELAEVLAQLTEARETNGELGQQLTEESQRCDDISEELRARECEQEALTSQLDDERNSRQEQLEELIARHEQELRDCATAEQQKAKLAAEPVKEALKKEQDRSHAANALLQAAQEEAEQYKEDCCHLSDQGTR